MNSKRRNWNDTEQASPSPAETENRLKEQLRLFTDPVSTEGLRTDQLRLYFSSLAYTLLLGPRRFGLRGAGWARAQTDDSAPAVEDRRTSARFGTAGVAVAGRKNRLRLSVSALKPNPKTGLPHLPGRYPGWACAWGAARFLSRLHSSESGGCRLKSDFFSTSWWL